MQPMLALILLLPCPEGWDYRCALAHLAHLVASWGHEEGCVASHPSYSPQCPDTERLGGGVLHHVSPSSITRNQGQSCRSLGQLRLPVVWGQW